MISDIGYQTGVIDMGTVFPTPRELGALWAAWSAGTVTAQDVSTLYDVVDPDRTAYYVLHRLTAKGWLERHDCGYSPAMTRQQAAEYLTGGTVCS